MKKLFLIIIGLFLGTGLTVMAAAPVQQVINGGTGSSTLTGILIGNGKSSVNTLTVGSNLTLTGTTLSASGGGSGSGTITTSTLQTLGTLPYWTSSGSTFPATLGFIATSAPTVTAPITYSGTLGAFVGGVGGTFACGSCLTANQSITLSGAVTGTGATAITTAFGTLAQGILGNPFVTATIPTALSTSTLYGNLTGTYGSTLSSNGSSLVLMATSTHFTGTTGQTAWFSGTGLLIGTSSLLFTSATSTFASDLLVKKTSFNAFSIQDSFGTNVLTVNTASTTGAILTIQATSTTDTLFSVDQYGHLTASSTPVTPAVSSCGTGTGTLSAGSNDVTGVVTTATAATACTITFGRAYSSVPNVLVTGASLVGFPAVTAVSQTAFTIGVSAAVTGDAITYLVIMQ